MSKLYSLVVLSMFCSSVFSQSETFVALDAPSQNLIKFNRYLVNPTFSIVGEKASKISLYNRRQWIDFDNSPEVYMLNYSGLLSERSGVGINLYQQNSGVLKNFGVMANYAYRLKMSEKIAFTFGFNTAYLVSGLNSSKVFGDPDPALQAMDDNSIFLFMPGGNLTIGRFDIGLYAENFIDYNLKTNETLTEFEDKTFSGHIMYTQPFNVGSGLFQDSELQLMARNRSTPYRGSVLSGSFLFDMPKIGWVQGGYNDFYGYSVGLGVNVSKHISFGYLLERGVNQDIKNFGNTHEITIAYSFDPRIKKEVKKEKELLKDKTDLEKDVEKLKKDVEDLKVNQASSNIARLENLKKSQPSNGTKIVSSVKDQVKTVSNSITPNTHDANGVQYQYLGKVPGVKSGYYVVTEVLKNELSAKKSIENLNIKGHKVSYFENVNNGYFYVYLDAFLSWEKVKNTVKSKYNGTYNGDLWVMDVAGDEKINIVLDNNNSEKNVTSTTRYNSEDLSKKSEEKLRLKYSSKTSKSRKTARKVAMNVTDVPSGYYLIASVFSVKSNADRFIDKLNAKGLNAKYFINPKNKFRYVYLEYSKEKSETLKSYYSNLNNSYFDEMWMMHVWSQKNSTPRIKRQYELITTEVPSGFYLVVSVFAENYNANNFLNELKKKGLNARYFVNPKNKYRYIYLVHSKNKALVSTAYYSNNKNTYFDEKWIMTVKNK